MAHVITDQKTACFYLVSIPEKGKPSMYIKHGKKRPFRAIFEDCHSHEEGIDGYIKANYSIQNFETYPVSEEKDAFVVLVKSGWPQKEGSSACLIHLDEIVPQQSDAEIHKSIWQTIESLKKH